MTGDEFHRERARLAQMTTAAQHAERVPKHRRILLDFEAADYQRSTDLGHTDPYNDPVGFYTPDIPRTHRKGQGELGTYLNKVSALAQHTHTLTHTRTHKHTQ